VRDARFVVRILVLAVLCASLTANGQPANSEADRLFEQGRALAKAGKHGEACPLFEKSLELDHSIGTQLNLADCREQLGQLREAWIMFTAAANESARSADAKRTAFARQRAAALATKLTTVVIKVTKPVVGLSITVAGNAVAPTSEIIDLEMPGMIEVVATLSGKTMFETIVTGTPGQTVHVTVPAFADPEVRTPELPGPAVQMERRPGRVRLAIGLLVGSGATAIAGTVLALKGRSDYNATADGAHCMRVAGGIVCDDTGKDEIASAQRLSNIGTVLAIGTGALVIGAAVAYFTAPYEAMTIAPMATATTAGVSLSGSF
jgi:hypothetical protein